MKRALAAAVLVIGPLMAADPSDTERIDEATAALPEQLRAEARVVATDAEGNERSLQEGRNGLVCFPDAPEPGFAVFCAEASVLAYMSAVGAIEAETSSEDEKRERIKVALKDGSLKTATPGGRAYVLSGPDRQRARLTMAIVLPWATGESTGLSTERSDGVWLMCPGAPGAHIMVGDIPYGRDQEIWKTCGW